MQVEQVQSGAEMLSLKIKIDDIQKAFAFAGGVTQDDINDSSREHKYAHPRQCAMLAVRLLTRNAYPMIGREFGDRDHTTVLFGANEAAKRLWLDVAPVRELLAKHNVAQQYTKHADQTRQNFMDAEKWLSANRIAFNADKHSMISRFETLSAHKMVRFAEPEKPKNYQQRFKIIFRAGALLQVSAAQPSGAMSPVVPANEEMRHDAI